MDDDAELTFTALHWMAAGLFLAAGAGATLARRPGRRTLDATARWAPLLAAPLAGAAHAARALRPTSATRTVARALDASAVGLAASGIAWGLYRAIPEEPGLWPRRSPTPLRALAEAAAPLAFGATGVLGLLLDREEREEEALLRRLERRARMVERLVPRRRPRLDHIVVHV